MSLNKIETIINFEKKYIKNDYNGINNGNSNFKIINGTIPIILSAPHAVKQFRNGIIKEEDKLTGAIVEYLCVTTGSNGIVRTCNLNDDPNYENKGVSLKYKEAILKLIKEKNIGILIDVHGCTNKHGFDIELGTNYGQNINHDTSILDILESQFSKIGKVVIDNKFRASTNTTVSNFINNNSRIPCIQIEISRKFRNENILLLLDAFENIIKQLSIEEQKKLESREEDDEISK